MYKVPKVVYIYSVDNALRSNLAEHLIFRGKVSVKMQFSVINIISSYH